MTAAPVLEAKCITKSYSGVRALRSASLDLQVGEVYGLVGENGAGKTTLTKILTGSISCDSGTLKVHGRPIL